MSLGLGAVFTGVQTASQTGVPPDEAGLAAALITASFQVGSALGLAVFSAIATTRTNHLLTAHAARPAALTSGFHLALLASSIALIAAAAIALRAPNTRGEPILHPDKNHPIDEAASPLPATSTSKLRG